MTTNKHRIRLAEDFSRHPGGRYIRTGPYSGESFLDVCLMPALNKYESIVVDLDGASAIPPSFLDQSFGVLMKKLGRAEFERRIDIHLTDDPDALDDLELIKSRRFQS